MAFIDYKSPNNVTRIFDQFIIVVNIIVFESREVTHLNFGIKSSFEMSVKAPTCLNDVTSDWLYNALLENNHTKRDFLKVIDIKQVKYKSGFLSNAFTATIENG